ncbi:MAG: carboxylating nicotinate-nucleotide diphosphorylase [Microthrixaceae bacterium]|nr:carboxylating nicotinate-nucleotide diphosphorylase [Acidimicrobiales bacterium]MCB9403040.1 carboxylating nicotinate-nucleotide diphosphorylase [Microthrixaceae bacterium]
MTVRRPFDAPRGLVRDLVARALAEDLDPLGDLTAGLLPPDSRAEARFVARSAGVVAGLACVEETFIQVDDSITWAWSVTDGDAVAPGTVLGTVSGPLASVLTAERTALNFLGHLSGIATATRAFVDAAAPLRVWDTRKTIPGLRALQKAAVRAGGARNHRGNLSDWVMFKDNHLTVLGIVDAVDRARDQWPGRTIHVECDRLDQVREALDAGADALLLDNMTPDEVRACVAVADDHAATHGTRRALLEVSGGITVDTVGSYSDTGVDVVSSGSLTNSVEVFDVGLDIEVSSPCC